MKTLKQIPVKVIKVEFMPKFENFEDNTVYISDIHGVSIHKCMCGCGEQTVLPISTNMWRYQLNTKQALSMQPSVGNYQLPCKSHYIFQNGNANFV